MAWYFLESVFSKPSVSRLTFSLVERTPSSLSFNMGSINPPTCSSISSAMGSILSSLPTPSTLPFLLMTRQLDFKISRMTLQISLNTTLLELLLCNNFPIFLVLSNNCTLLICYPPDCQEKISPISQKPITVTF